MELRQIQAGKFVWFKYSDADKILCRVRYVGRDYVSLTVVAATAEQVINSGYGVGEPINTVPQSLEPATVPNGWQQAKGG